jgi:hypothetical protein
MYLHILPLAIRLIPLGIIVTGLLYWLFRPTEIPTTAQLSGAVSVAGSLLLIAAAAGVASMATVQFWKVLFQPRSAFNAMRLQSYFGENAAQILGVAAPELVYRRSLMRNHSLPKAVDELLDNPTEVVMGQIRSAADYIMLRPQEFKDKDLLVRLAGRAGHDAVGMYLTRGSDDDLVAVRYFVEQRLNLLHSTLKDSWRRRVRVLALFVAALMGGANGDPLGPRTDG